MSGGWAIAMPNLPKQYDQCVIEIRTASKIPYSREPKAFAQCLQDAQVAVFLYQSNGTGMVSCEIDIRLIDDDDAFEVGVVEDCAY